MRRDVPYGHVKPGNPHGRTESGFHGRYGLPGPFNEVIFGYPTPLLDWTYSPFISAYFAFKKASTASGKVRIFVFDRSNWIADWKQLQKITPARLHFSLLDAIAINNTRMIPQQALASVTNAEDIESYIGSMGRADRKYLQVIDLPVEQRTEVLRELSMMGINAGSLFPGLDGACTQLRDRFFGV
jgi:hypothetical protein